MKNDWHLEDCSHQTLEMTMMLKGRCSTIWSLLGSDADKLRTRDFFGGDWRLARRHGRNT